MNGYGAQWYKKVGVDSSVAAAPPHRLVLMLFDGVLESVRLARTQMVAGRVADKGQSLGKAVRIVEEGLKASLDRRAGGQLAGKLAQLYDYLSMRLLQANLRNDRAALDEVERLLADLRGAWAQIDQTPRSQAALASSPSPGRRLAISA